MPRYKIKFFTGPTLVKQIAEAFREVNIRFPDSIHDIFGGTEHVYLTAEGYDFHAAVHNALADLYRVHGTDFGLRGQRP